MKTLSRSRSEKGETGLLISVILLSLVGTVFIYSASKYSAKATYNDSLFFVKKQLIGIILGIISMLIFGNVEYGKLKKFNIPLCVLSLIMLALVFVPVIGVENYGAKRWIGFGGITVQPSEIAKFSVILFFASYISDHPEKMKSFKGILPLLLYGLTVCALIISEPNMSITVCVMVLIFSLLFVGGVPIKFLLMLIIPALIFGVVLILIAPYRLDRLMAFLDPWASPKGEGYQLLQSLYALGSGGWFGVGLFNSRQKYAFLPFSESDFILSVIGEEVGFFGTVCFFLIIIFIIYKGIKIASKSKDVFGFILSLGITLIFAIQSVVNVLVVTGSIPPTGLPLPLVSSGNTSIIIFMTEMGVLYNVSKHSSLTF